MICSRCGNKLFFDPLKCSSCGHIFTQKSIPELLSQQPISQVKKAPVKSGKRETDSLLEALLQIAFKFEGQINRSVYWAGNIWLTISWLFLQRIVLTPLSNDDSTVILSFALTLLLLPILIWISMALQVKRWRDLGVTGWAAITVFIPIVNIIVFFFILGLLPGTKEPHVHSASTTKPLTDSA